MHGDVTFDRATLDDWILVRSDGTPTYTFCVVVDVVIGVPLLVGLML